MSNLKPLDFRRRLEESHAGLMRLLTGVTEEQFKRRPPATPEDPSPWCIAEVLAHCLTIEETWAERMKLTLDQDGATITPTPESLHQDGAHRGRAAAVPQLIHGLLGVRHETLKCLERATAPDGSLLANSAWHPRLQKTLDLAWMLDKVAGHAEEHLPQIAATRTAVGARELAPEPTP